MVTSAIDEDIAAYETIRQELEANSTGKWALVCDQKLIALFDSFERAAQDAVSRFGRGPYLIRQVGALPLTLPASVMYYPINGQRQVRI